MSIEASYRRIAPEEFEKLQIDPEAAAAYFGNDLDLLGEEDWEKALLARADELAANEKHFDLGNDWHALQFLLTGIGEVEPANEENSPYLHALQGDVETEWECTYGKVRMLTVDQVRAAAKALSKISKEELQSRYDAEAFSQARIYPAYDSWGKGDAEMVVDLYSGLVEFFQRAAKAGEVVLVFRN